MRRLREEDGSTYRAIGEVVHLPPMTVKRILDRINA